MRIILVSCILLSTCSITFAAEYVEDVYELQPSKKDKRFIFNKSAQIQKLIRGLTSFSSISNSNSRNVPLPPPVQSTTAKPPATTPGASGVTLAIPDYQSTTPAPQKNNDFDNDLEFLTQYRDNAYALPETASAGQSQPKFDRLPSLPQKQASDDKPTSSSRSFYSSPQQFISTGLSFGADGAPETLPQALYSQPLPYLSAHQTQLTLLPGNSQTYLPQQHVIPAPQISPVTYQTQQQAHLSYVSPIQTTAAVAATVPLRYDQYQSFSDNHYSFSNHLLNSAHIQSAYFGNSQSTGAQCACGGYK